MMHALAAQPAIALFLALALGHLIGAIRVGPIQLGGVCGTLTIALLLGQSGVRLDADLKNVAFALFIFALGFTGGPQFFANIRQGWRFGALELDAALWLASDESKYVTAAEIMVDGGLSARCA